MPTTRRLILLILFACISMSCSLPLDLVSSQLPPGVTLLYAVKAGLVNGLAFSPDGRYLAISTYSFTYNSSSIQLIDLVTNTNSLITQTDAGELRILQWGSHNGELILLSPGGENQSGILAMNPLIANESPRFISEGIDASLDNDGNLAVLRFDLRSQTRKIFMQNILGEREELIYLSSEPISNISWVSSNSQIALLIHSGSILDPGGIFALDISDSRLTRIGVLDNVSSFSISPSSKFVVVVSRTPGDNSYFPGTVAIMTIDGRCKRTLEDIGAIGFVAWLPDESAVVFLQSNNNVYSLNILEHLGIENLTTDAICMQN